MRREFPDLTEDKDRAKALDLVTKYSASFENDVNDLLRALHAIEPFDEAMQRSAIGRKLRHAAAVVRQLDSDEVRDLPRVLADAAFVFEQRNAEPTSADLYALANAIWDFQERLIGALIFRLPRAVRSYGRSPK